MLRKRVFLLRGSDSDGAATGATDNGMWCPVTATPISVVDTAQVPHRVLRLLVECHCRPTRLPVYPPALCAGCLLCLPRVCL